MMKHVLALMTVAMLAAVALGADGGVAVAVEGAPEVQSTDSGGGSGANLIVWDAAKSNGGWEHWSPRAELAPVYIVDEPNQGASAEEGGNRSTGIPAHNEAGAEAVASKALPSRMALSQRLAAAESRAVEQGSRGETAATVSQDVDGSEHSGRQEALPSRLPLSQRARGPAQAQGPQEGALQGAGNGRGTVSLGLSGGGVQHVFGGWRHEVRGLREGQYYRFAGDVYARGVGSLRRNVTCRIRWTGSNLGNDALCSYATEFAKGEDGSATFEQAFMAPKGTEGAWVELLLDQAGGAEVTFSSVALVKAAAPAARRVTVATIYWRPAERSTPARNVEAFCALIDKAAKSKPDVVLLSEAITLVGTGLKALDAAEPVEGPTFKTLAAKAKEHNCYVIYGAYEKEGDVVYNSAIIIGRDGERAGVFRKVQLPENEPDAGLSPGDSFDTFQLDFGRIGILICYDTAFPEPARVEALKGAEILFVPIWGGDPIQLRARALDNAVWVVTAGYDVASMVIDPSGTIGASTWKDQGDGVAVQTIDLSKSTRRDWIGDWRNQVTKQRRTDAYGPVVEE